jgi:hypothetical protein
LSGGRFRHYTCNKKLEDKGLCGPAFPSHYAVPPAEEVRGSVCYVLPVNPSTRESTSNVLEKVA